jgi:arginine-tRNA-protein transferase
LLEGGWRRSGMIFYKNDCPGCSSCIPIRLAAAELAPSPSQRRCLKKNKDLSVVLSPLEYREDRFLMYKSYSLARHDYAELDPDGEREAYRTFLIRSPLPGAISDYYLDGPGGRRLIASGYLDILPSGISSVYFVFDPGCSRRSLGVYSVFKEAELCLSIGKPWYYLGFWVPGSPKMDYKASFRPNETSSARGWEKAPGGPGTLTN